MAAGYSYIPVADESIQGINASAGLGYKTITLISNDYVMPGVLVGAEYSMFSISGLDDELVPVLIPYLEAGRLFPNGLRVGIHMGLKNLFYGTFGESNLGTGQSFIIGPILYYAVGQ